jgi:cell division protein FtsA
VDRVLGTAGAIALPSGRDILHVLPQSFVVDGQEGISNPVGMSGERLEAKVHVVTTLTASAQNVVKCCQRIGLHVDDLVLEPLAAAEAVLTQEEKEIGVAVIDLGAGTTDILVFAQGALRHTALLSLGGNHVTNDVAAGLKTHFREAEVIKQRSGCALARAVRADQMVEVYGAGGRNARLIPRQMLAQVIEARAEELLALARHQIVKCGFDEELGAGVVLTGGTALLEGIVPLAEGIFQTQVRIGVPTDVTPEDGGAPMSVRSPAYAAAVGLVRHGANPRDHVPTRLEEQGAFDRVRKRVTDWIEAFF